MLNLISALIIPTVVILIITNGLLKKEPVFDYFTDGAKNGFETSIKILPSLVGLLVAVSMFRASGLLDALENIISPALNYIHFPKELVPLALIRPVSGSASLAIVRDILNTYGADSFVGRCASVMMGSTETTFYTIALYCGAAKIRNTRHALAPSLTADFAGFIFSVLTVQCIMRNS